MNILLRQFKSLVSIKFIVIWSFLIIGPIIFAVSKSDEYMLFRPVDLFTLILENILPMLFPLIVVCIFLLNFSNEKKDHFLFYTRSRIPIKKYLKNKFWLNNFSVFTVIFLFVFIPFVFCFYIEPSLGLVKYYPIESESDISTHTFSQFLSYGSLVYGVVYSLWVALNGVLYAAIAFFLLMTINNSFLALSLPFIFYHIVDFGIAILGFSKFSLTSTIFPFNIVQQPLWTVIVPFFFLALILLCLYIYIRKNFYKLDALL